MAAHAHSADGIKTAIRAGVDSIEHASLIDDEGTRLAKEKGTVMVMDIYVDTFILERGAETGMLPESIRKEKEVGQAQRQVRTHRGHGFGGPQPRASRGNGDVNHTFVHFR